MTAFTRLGAPDGSDAGSFVTVGNLCAGATRVWLRALFRLNLDGATYVGDDTGLSETAPANRAKWIDTVTLQGDGAAAPGFAYRKRGGQWSFGVRDTYYQGAVWYDVADPTDAWRDCVLMAEPSLTAGVDQALALQVRLWSADEGGTLAEHTPGAAVHIPTVSTGQVRADWPDAPGDNWSVYATSMFATNAEGLAISLDVKGLKVVNGFTNLDPWSLL